MNDEQLEAGYACLEDYFKKLDFHLKRSDGLLKLAWALAGLATGLLIFASYQFFIGVWTKFTGFMVFSALLNLALFYVFAPPIRRRNKKLLTACFWFRRYLDTKPSTVEEGTSGRHRYCRKMMMSALEGLEREYAPRDYVVPSKPWPRN